MRTARICAVPLHRVHRAKWLAPGGSATCSLAARRLVPLTPRNGQPVRGGRFLGRHLLDEHLLEEHRDQLRWRGAARAPHQSRSRSLWAATAQVATERRPGPQSARGLQGLRPAGIHRDPPAGATRHCATASRRASATNRHASPTLHSLPASSLPAAWLSIAVCVPATCPFPATRLPATPPRAGAVRLPPRRDAGRSRRTRRSSDGARRSSTGARRSAAAGAPAGRMDTSLRRSEHERW